MQQHEIHSYLHRFFTANQCEIKQTTDALLDIQLTIEMDKLLMNRPFYWHYLEKTGGAPNPMRVTFITDPQRVPEDVKGEAVHYGSPRLHQVFRASQELGAYIRLYEDIHTDGRSGNVPLHPWLGINMKVSYQCDRKKETLYSLGLHLITGMMVSNFHETLQTIPLTPKIPDFCFTLTPMIKPQSGLLRIEEAVKQLVSREDHTWAEEARERWAHDQKLLDQFYTDMEDIPDSYEIEKQALQEQYEPKIIFEIINGGLFYITPNRIV